MSTLHSVNIDNAPVLSWQSKKEFTASTTLSEKVGRVVNNLVFVSAIVTIGALVTRQLRQVSPAISYAAYASIALTLRKIVSASIGYIVYPATTYSRQNLQEIESDAISTLNQQGFVTQKIALYKSGVAYDATIIGHRDTLSNGKWSVHALGNGMAMEQLMDSIPYQNKANGVNTLLINGPAVGRSKGYPTRYQLGAGFEAGLQFLEKEVKATHIIFKGLSLGGGMMSEGALAHQFDTTKFKYLAISDRTFCRLSDIAAAFVGFIATAAFFLAGAELDSISSAEKLKNLNIQHIIIQHNSERNEGTDGVVPDKVALAPALTEAPNRTFLLSPKIPHNGNLPSEIQEQSNTKIKEFLSTT